MKWIIIALVSVLIIGAGAYFFMSSSDSDGDEVTSSVSGESLENTSYSKLLARGDNLKCTYDYTDDEGSRSFGTAYFTKDRMYGDFTNTTADGQSSQAYVVRNGDTQYVWQKDTKEGYKSEVSESTEETQKEQSEAIDPDQNYEFKCVSWTVDGSLLEVPTDVDFIDISAQLQQSQEATKNACSQITDATARSACEASL